MLGQPFACDVAYAVVRTAKGYIAVELRDVVAQSVALADPRGVHRDLVPETRPVAHERLRRGIHRRAVRVNGWKEEDAR